MVLLSADIIAVCVKAEVIEPTVGYTIVGALLPASAVMTVAALVVMAAAP